MDVYLKLLADAGLALDDAEQAAGAGEATQARDALDGATNSLAELRAAWPEMTPPQRAIVGRAAAQLRARLDAANARLPKRAALSEGAPERDPDEEIDPVRAPA